MKKVFLVDKPMGKPRMTRRDAWQMASGNPRACVARWFAYKDTLKYQARDGFTVPESNYILTFLLPVPRSWSETKKEAHHLQPHQSRPDKDNLEKGFLDALCSEDAHIWSGLVIKRWVNSVQGQIVIEWDPTGKKQLGFIDG